MGLFSFSLFAPYAPYVGIRALCRVFSRFAFVSTCWGFVLSLLHSGSERLRGLSVKCCPFSLNGPAVGWMAAGLVSPATSTAVEGDSAARPCGEEGDSSRRDGLEAWEWGQR